METFSFDIMIDDRFICTMEYPYNPAFPITDKELREFIISKRPSMAHRDFKVKPNKGFKQWAR